jgi:endonuclease/exonuclease/phosphatase family metal-dependent hydrolase
MDFSLASFNIWATFADWSKRRQALKEAFKEIDKPDILCLQEVIVDNNTNQAQEIAEDLKYPFLLFKTERPSDYSDGVEGQAILSSFPFQETNSIKLFHTTTPRIATSFSFPDLKIIVTNTHLSYSEDNESQKQLVELLSNEGSNQWPELLCGDFNQTPDQVDSILENFPEWRRDVNHLTWPVDPEQFRIAREQFLGHPIDFETEARQIDYILCRGTTELVTSKKFDLKNNGLCASDHALICNSYKR